MIKYTYNQKYNTCTIYNLFNIDNKTNKIMNELELIDNIVENMESYDLALNLIKKSYNK
jgi:flagellar biosynthesis regulator FlbT